MVYPTTRTVLHPTTRTVLHPTTRTVLHPTTRTVLHPTTRTVLHPTTRTVLHPTTRTVTYRQGLPEQSQVEHQLMNSPLVVFLLFLSGSMPSVFSCDGTGTVDSPRGKVWKTHQHQRRRGGGVLASKDTSLPCAGAWRGVWAPVGWRKTEAQRTYHGQGRSRGALQQGRWSPRCAGGRRRWRAAVPPETDLWGRCSATRARRTDRGLTGRWRGRGTPPPPRRHLGIQHLAGWGNAR